MSKFARTATAPLPAGPVRFSGAVTATYEGGTGYGLDEKGELFTLAVTNMVGENTFYENGANRDDRFVELVRKNAAQDPEWTAGLIGWLRTGANMRSASIVAAIEYVKAGAPNGRQVVAKALQRADEPAEALAYHISTYGKRIPQPIKRGIADAAQRLYNEKTPLKYDSSNAAVRPADVLELCHVKPTAPWQSKLFQHLIDRRHGREMTAADRMHLFAHGLRKLHEAYHFDLVPGDQRRAHLAENGLPEIYTWERLAGWLPGGMDAEAWEAVIPQMGYMALLRNLNNFEKAKISRQAVELVRSRLTNPQEIERSKQFPYRFFSAFKALDGSMTYASALEDALELSVANIPNLPGRTLVMVDWSGSMWDRLSSRSQMNRVDAANVFAGAIARRSHADVWAYGDSMHQVEVRSVLGLCKLAKNLDGTETWRSTAEAWSRGKYDRVVIITDEQSRDSEGNVIPRNVPVYVWNLAGYGRSTLKPGSGRYVLGGLSDAAFNVIPMLERGEDAPWPWMADAGAQ